MLNDLFRTYKKIIILVLILLSAVVFWFYGCHRQKDGAKQTQSWKAMENTEDGAKGYAFRTSLFSGEVTFGTKGYLAEDKCMPVAVRISCQEEVFNGTLRITLPGKDGKGISYQSAVNCKKGETSVIHMDIPNMGNVAYFYFEILDSFGTVKLAEGVVPDDEKKNTKAELAEKKIYLGVLSEEYASLQYLEDISLQLDLEDYRLHLIRFTADDFPEQRQELGSLSGILIDHFDTGALSAKQKDCLLGWVREEGGKLFLGTGAEARMVMGGLTKDLYIQSGKVTEKQYDFQDEFSHAGSVRLFSASLNFSHKENWESYPFSYPASLYGENLGEGKIFVIPFSMMDETFIQWTGRDKVAQLFFQKGMDGEIRWLQQDKTSMWYVKKALYAFMNGRHPNTLFYALFFIVYLLVLGFFAYYVLRKMKKREYIWGVVPLIAVFFTICLTIRTDGGNSEAEKSFAALRINDQGQDEYYFLYQNNEGEESHVDLVPSIQKVEPLDYEYQTDLLDNTTIRSINQEYTINNTRKGFDLAFEESVPGTSYILKCSAAPVWASKNQCFAADIQAEHSAFSGSIHNISSLDFQKVVLIRGRQYAVINNVAAGETVEIQEEKVKFYHYFQGENQLFGEEEETTSIGNLEEYLQQKYILNNQEQNRLLIAGITREDDFTLFSNGRVPGNHLSVFIDRFSLPVLEEGKCIIDINDDSLEEENQGSLLEEGILEKNETKAVYSFDPSDVIWGMFRNRDGFEGTIYAYNYRTQEYDMILKEPDEYMNCGQLEPYISEMNKMSLRFCLPSEMDYGGAPALSVITKKLDHAS